MRGCHCMEADAKDYLKFEIENLKSLRDENDLHYEDFIDSCKGLGLDEDYISFFVLQVSI